MIRIIINGALGRMGRLITEEVEADNGLELAGAVEAAGHEGLGTAVSGIEVTDSLREIIEKGDVIVDFTNPESALGLIHACSESKKAAVVGTTGFSVEQLVEIRKASEKTALFMSPNMSVGVNLMFKVTGDVAAALPDFDIEISEIHHNRKKDSPSGTASKLADIVEEARPGADRVHGRRGMVGTRNKKEIGIHSLRGGDVVGEHTVVFAGEGERFELTHRAHSRRTFARGAIRAMHFISNKRPGLYSMADVLGF